MKKAHGGDRRSEESKDQIDPLKTADRLATEHGVSPSSVKRAGKSRVSDWLSRTVKEQKGRQNTKIIERWLACWTQEEIAAELNMAQKTVDDRLKILADKYRQNHSAKITFADDFTPPIYNIWKQQVEPAKNQHDASARVCTVPSTRTQAAERVEPTRARRCLHSMSPRGDAIG